MAKIIDPPYGRMSGTIDNMTFHDTKDGQLVKSKVPKNKRRNKNDDKQIAQQKKFKYCSKFSCYFRKGLSKAYPEKTQAKLHRIFIKINKKAIDCNPETFVTTIDYSKFLCSDGNLVPPEVLIKREDEKSVFTIEVLPQELTPLCRPDDDVFIMFMDPHTKYSFQEAFHLGKRGETKSFSLKLPEKGHFFMCYYFALSHNGKNPSPSIYRFIELGYDYLNMKNYDRDFKVMKGGEILEIPPSYADLKLLEKLRRHV